MPDQVDVARVISELESRVELPEDFFEKRGAVGTHWDDTRQYPRFYFRTEAAMEIRPSLPALQRWGGRQRVYVKDISRTAVAILHCEQLFPGERLSLMFIDGVERQTTVTRCRRVQANCYEVAARFDVPDPAQG